MASGAISVSLIKPNLSSSFSGQPTVCSCAIAEVDTAQKVTASAVHTVTLALENRLISDVVNPVIRVPRSQKKTHQLSTLDCRAWWASLPGL